MVVGIGCLDAPATHSRTFLARSLDAVNRQASLLGSHVRDRSGMSRVPVDPEVPPGIVVPSHA